MNANGKSKPRRENSIDTYLAEQEKYEKKTGKLFMSYGEWMARKENRKKIKRSDHVDRIRTHENYRMAQPCE